MTGVEGVHVMKKIVSYVFPIYNEEGNIPLLYETVTSLIKERGKNYDFEIVFVNDGSRDNSLQLLQDLQKRDDRVVVINFARNFGHQIAVTAGIDHAKGDAIIIMDSDMQDPPLVSFDLIDKWKEGFDVVYAQRRTRKDTYFKKLTAHWYYIVLKKLANIDIPRNTGDFRLIDRRVADALAQFKEHNRFLRGLVSYVGFKQVAVQFDRDERHAGETGYPLKKMVQFASDGIFGFSSTPLMLISRVGFFISGLSFLGIIYALIVKFSSHNTVPGWTFTVIAILFIGGIQLIMLGILGNYIGRIYTETQQRPLYFIESIKRKEN